MSYNLRDNSGLSGVFTIAGTAIGSTPQQYSYANTIQYAIDGISYSKAADASEAFTPVSGSMVNIGSTGGNTFVAFVINAAGDLRVVQGAVVGRGELAPVPDIPAGYVCYGGVKIESTTTFTFGTTSLAAGTVTDTYYNFSGRPPFTAI